MGDEPRHLERVLVEVESEERPVSVSTTVSTSVSSTALDRSGDSN
ncbi:hypothetical protein ACFWQL_01065 [Amycolatopsis thermoflava]